jgi:hypothetical protein
MAVGLKLLVAFATGALAASVASDASAKSKPVWPKPAPVVQATQTPPAAPPRQFFAVQGM